MIELTKETIKHINSKDFGIMLFYATNCKYCELIKPIFESYSEKYPQLQFSKIEMAEGHEYYMRYAENTQEVVYEEIKDPNGNIEAKAVPQNNEDGTPKMIKKVVIPSFYVHHTAAITLDNEFGFIGGFDGASEQELKMVCESIISL